MKYSYCKQIIEYLLVNLRDNCVRIEPAGSFRRKKADCGDLELVCIPKPGAPRPEFGQKRLLTSHLDAALYRMECDGRLGRRVKDGEKYKQIVIDPDAYGIAYPTPFYLDLFIVRPETWGVQFAIRTGSSDFSHKFVTHRQWGGWLPDHMQVKDGLLWDMKKKEVIPTFEEIQFFDAIGLGWKEPETRTVI
jgi:DNA polymerase/3'-5' exonuclease PolX